MPIGKIMLDWDLGGCKRVGIGRRDSDMGHAHGGFSSPVSSPVDYLSWEADLFLDRETGDLGLWQRRESPKSGRVIL